MTPNKLILVQHDKLIHLHKTTNKMKRGIKKGTRRSPERIFLEKLKSGDSFYTTKKDKDMTALSSVCNVLITTEKVICVHPKTLVAEKIVKCTIL